MVEGDKGQRQVLRSRKHFGIRAALCTQQEEIRGDGVRHRGTRWVNHGQEPHKAQVGAREVHGICVKLEGLWKLLLRQVQVLSWKNIEIEFGGVCLALRVRAEPQQT
uniref:Uncharacterized protein n=1 Tax=Taeniopygia guttata TaxID=59729 RepID=A0A674GFF4_TAEGU